LNFIEECSALHRYDLVIMNLNIIEERTIALAGVLQACSQVQNLARNGRVNQFDFDACAIEDVEVLRYVATVLHLQTQLYRDRQKFTAFGTEVDRLSACDQDSLVEAFSEVYQTYISAMRPQIIVQGESEYLQNVTIPPQVRALLLAALRSAVLWQQKGGGRLKLLWERTRMRNAARDLLRQTTQH